MGKCRGTMQLYAGEWLWVCMVLHSVELRLQCYTMYIYCMSLGINFRETGLQNPFQRHSLTMKCTLQ